MWRRCTDDRPAVALPRAKWNAKRPAGLRCGWAPRANDMTPVGHMARRLTLELDGLGESIVVDILSERLHLLRNVRCLPSRADLP